MPSRSKRVAAVMLVVALAALAAGCGGGKKTAVQTLSASTTITRGSGSLTITSPTPSFASAKNCRDLAGLAAKAAAAVAASGSSSSAVQTESAELQALANAAPSDIKGDFQTFAAAFTGFEHAIQSSGYKLGSKTPPTAAQAAAFARAAKAFNTPKLRQAEQHLTAWAHKNCGGFGG
jgi:hypothetical protein